MGCNGKLLRNPSPFSTRFPQKLNFALTTTSSDMYIGLGYRWREPADICILCSTSHHRKSNYWVWHRNRFLYRTHVPIRTLSKGVSRSPCVPRSPIHWHRHLFCILVGYSPRDTPKTFMANTRIGWILACPTQAAQLHGACLSRFS